jgi:hypothetical protein
MPPGLRLNRHATARCRKCEPAKCDCEPRINHVGSGANNVGREYPTESMILGQNGRSIASRASN